MRDWPQTPSPEDKDLWDQLEERIEEVRRHWIEPVDERLEHEIELWTEASEAWLRDELIHPYVPLTVDYLVVGFSEELRRRIVHYLRGMGLAAVEAPDNRAAHAMLRAYHARAALFDAGRPAPGAFVRLARELQPHIKMVPIGDPNNSVLLQRMRRRGAAAFLPQGAPRGWRQRVDAVEQCLLAILNRQAAVCPNFAQGRPCRGECALLEPRPPRPSGAVIPFR